MKRQKESNRCCAKVQRDLHDLFMQPLFIQHSHIEFCSDQDLKEGKLQEPFFNFK